MFSVDASSFFFKYLLKMERFKHMIVCIFHHRIVLIDDALDCLISFSDFIYAFQVQFYYEGKLSL